jgi:histidinol dehydrogenase
VCEAKRQVFGQVGVDLLPGPSEVMVIADASARLDFAAADLLAQAEHGSGREKIYLVATSRGIIAGVAAEIARQLPDLARSERTRRVLDDGFLAVEVAASPRPPRSRTGWRPSTLSSWCAPVRPRAS